MTTSSSLFLSIKPLKSVPKEIMVFSKFRYKNIQTLFLYDSIMSLFRTTKGVLLTKVNDRVCLSFNIDIICKSIINWICVDSQLHVKHQKLNQRYLLQRGKFLTFDTSKIFVPEFQERTLAVVPLS